jgi:hypothetical protein
VLLDIFTLTCYLVQPALLARQGFYKERALLHATAAAAHKALLHSRGMPGVES